MKGRSFQSSEGLRRAEGMSGLRVPKSSVLGPDLRVAEMVLG